MALRVVARSIACVGLGSAPADVDAPPAILLLHGSEGAWAGWSHRTAVLLAVHGFLAVPFGYSVGGNGWNAGAIADVPLDRTAAALAALRVHAGSKVGLYGVSRGAEHALLLASLMARDGVGGLPDAIAVHAAPDTICGAFDARTWRDRGDPGFQPWDPARRAWTWRGRSDGLLPSTPIEIERYDGPLMLTHGTADSVWSVAQTRRLETRLRAAGRAPLLHYYADQDHVPRGADEDAHLRNLLDFFGRALGGEKAA